MQKIEPSESLLLQYLLATEQFLVLSFEFVMWLPDSMVIYFYGYFNLPARLRDHGSCERGDNLFLIRRVTSNDHVVRELYDNMGSFLSL